MERGRVLVLDDDSVITMACKRILGAEGYDVVVSNTGKEALNQLGKDTFDLFVSDVRLPDISGITVLKESKIIQPKTDVVMITGYPTMQDARESIKLGAFEYIEKPFTPDFMVNIAKKIFDKRGWVLRQSFINEFKEYVVPLRGENPHVYYKEGLWARPVGDGLWEMGCDLRDQMAAGEMMFVDFIKDMDTVKSGEPFIRLLSSSGTSVELLSPMSGEIREFNLKANDVLSSLAKDHLSEGWLLWLVRVIPMEI
ncbi:response regulator [Candidatus Magnetomonas plexicatena]|uniref:response regulator n=1 Tax=Candidatus Magnetomonas plexicatena TaxID=2552947 RepID=UPI001C77CE89|nr:response regulator [Nitrospirales bacterium LBB_01]